MANTSTKIEWTDVTWSPTTGCSRVSAGCDHCYAMHMARRFDGQGKGYDGTTRRTERGTDWTGVVHLHEDRLTQPLSWRKPRRVFVDSMSDLFHPSVPFAFVDKVFAVMALASDHVFQILTKRPGRMAEYLKKSMARSDGRGEAVISMGYDDPLECLPWPLPNVWLGTSVEDQAAADERIPHLLRCPAAVRFLSCEPLLGPVDLSPWLPETGTLAFVSPEYAAATGAERGSTMRIHPKGGSLDWVIVGGESGPGARPMQVGWARDLVRQCQNAGVAAFVKQLGSRPEDEHGFPMHLTDSKGGDPDEWPDDLRVREMPQAAEAAHV